MAAREGAGPTFLNLKMEEGAHESKKEGDL